ncbi:hypothetical protein DYBT9275_05287 [Dyadobacter sp. CECT 9275]|uniref:DUF1080 domain-containing protein n=1 Tax=Dyadobacter helix TaxID=2822344 RepID=A0A916JGV7_9BACT|nr:family 16 glycoside hydrolase [Dyadobacter sp. CECT 9275]CAG5012935.1 hypothetical protein DYBT9275_05287 [Dyadobacter sp. CECT 9275]
MRLLYLRFTKAIFCRPVKTLQTLLLLLSMTPMYAQPTTDNRFFNGKSLNGWTASDLTLWSVQDGVIIGKATKKVGKNQFLWSEVKVADFYLSIDVQLGPNDRNAGIQFRSQKVNAYGQARGYQADMGKDVWGRLYHEHGRGKLFWSDRGEKAVKPGQWNHYEILASGDRIWTAINGKIAVAVRDKGGDTSGYIALQIHSGDPQTVRYKIKKLVHNPVISLAGLGESALNEMLEEPLDKRLGSTPLHFSSADPIVFAGGTNIANMRKDAYLETMLLAGNPQLKLKLRNLGWDGDTVYEQFRDVGFGSWSSSIDSLGAGTVFVQFGQTESLEGMGRLESFVSAYKNLLNTIRHDKRRIFLLSPTPFEPDKLSHTTENPLAAAPLEKYVEAVRDLAALLGIGFVDVYHPLQKSALAGTLTTNGIHLTAEGQRLMASAILRELKLPDDYTEKLEPLRDEILRKNILWFNYWRPGNWAFLYGDRMTVPFSHDWTDKSKRIFPEEMKLFENLMKDAENRIYTEQTKLVRAY